MTKRTHKIINFIETCLLLCPLLTSCMTIDQLGISMDGLFSNKNNSSNTKSSVSKIEKKTPITKEALKLPKDYQVAYEYRTEKSNSVISNFIKDKKNESLRKSDAEVYLKQICQNILSSSEDTFMQTKMAHDAVCLLISYDAKNFWANTIPNQDWKTVLQSRTAVCEGYSNLFKKFCDELKIPCQKVTGYARGVGFNLLSEDTTENHAWNIVQIEGAWYFIDTTWDSGYMSGKNSVSKYSTQWLFTKPEQFIFTHYPKQEKYQLLAEPLSIQNFKALPYLIPAWWDNSENNNTNVPFQKITEIESIYTIEVPVKSDFIYDFKIRNSSTNQEVQNRVFTECTENKEKITLSFPATGKYTIDIYYRNRKSKTSESCGQFIINAAEGSNVKFPTVYNTSCENLEIIEPKNMPLSKGKNLHFEINVLNKKNVAVIIGKTYIQLENDGTGLFKGDVTIPANISKLSIGVSNSVSGKYEMIASYEVK